MRSFRQTSGSTNRGYRDDWVAGTLERLALGIENPELLDVGAGQSPYRQASEALGFVYESHDFNSYVPNPEAPGLQNPQWDYAAHKYVCDILEIPNQASADVVLCTEVLEHVPDPVAALSHLSSLVKPGGFLVVTVPFLSLMHQAPFWFSSGLSPFWFEFWSKSLGLEVDDLSVQGDYADLMAQEISRIFAEKSNGLGHSVIRRQMLGSLSRLFKGSGAAIRSNLSTAILETGGFGTLFVGRKPSPS